MPPLFFKKEIPESGLRPNDNIDFSPHELS
jgi:hypothetical protein